ncbi:hypothetical protein K440DRAFT_617714 [Wilcoxina mikolae CBS 423.85]|nr:hypothetical protein K440DRAFT_617714 [Wilcoxina mikolae CBS 423.85]
MAEPTQQRRVRESNFMNIGVAGRKTGLSIQDTGQRDVDGMEDMDNFFSPEKVALPPPRTVNGGTSSSNEATSPVGAVSKFESTIIDQTATEATMQLVSSSGIEPTEALTQRRQLSLPPATSRSPVRFTVSGTPRRGSSIGPKSSPTRPLDSSPIRASSPARRLDFSRNRRSTSVLGSPIRKTTPKPNGKAPTVVIKEPKAASQPPEPVLEAVKEPAKQPVVARKKQLSLVKKAILEEDTRSVQEAEPPSLPVLPVPKKKPAKCGLLSGKPTASKTFAFDDDETDDEAESGAEDTTKERNTVDDIVSRMLDDTTEVDLASTQEDVDMIDSPEMTRDLAEAEDITQVDDADEPEPEPAKSKKTTKPRKLPTPEPAPVLDVVTQKKAGKSRKVATPEPEPEEEEEEDDDVEDLEPTLLKKRGGKQVPAKKPAPAKAKKLAPVPNPVLEDVGEDEEDEIVEPVQPKKRAEKQPPAKKPAAKKAPEPEPEVPVAKGKNKGKGKAVAPLSPSTKKKSAKTSKVAVNDDVEMGEAPSTSQANKKSAQDPASSKGRGKKIPQAEKVVEPVLQEADDEVEEDVQEPPKKKPRGTAKPKTTRPIKSIVSNRAPKSIPKQPAKAPRSRKPPSPQEEEAEPAEDIQEDEAEEEAPPASRPRKGKAPASKKPPAKNAEKRKEKAPEPSTALSEETKGIQRVIHEKPPPTPRDESADAEGKRRSNRRRLAPLQFWKGEKVQYELGGVDGEDRRKSAVRMPEMVEVIRIESDEEEKAKRAPRKRMGSAAPTSKKRKRTVSKEEADEGESDPGEPDAWEQGIGLSEEDVGIKRGMIRKFPPYADEDGEDILEEIQLAYTKEKIVTSDVANGSFKFVKTFTQDGFGTGIMEIPPGGSKRVKSSGKMSLVFYMLLGRATVNIAGNRFRVGKGGQFMVPRGNLYSIENEFDSDAKMFFAQGRDILSEQAAAEEEEEEEED